MSFKTICIIKLMALAVILITVVQPAFSQLSTTGKKEKNTGNTSQGLTKDNFGSLPANGQGTKGETDLALVSCTTKWLSKDQVSVTWTVRNNGTGSCPLISPSGEYLVTYTVDGTTDKTVDNSTGNWSRLADSTPLACTKKELRPGDTATGNFTFDASSTTDPVVLYKVTLDTEKCGVAESNQENNTYLGRVGN